MVRADGRNRVHLGLVAVAALLVLAALACGGGGEEGLQLVFYSDRDGDDDIYIMDADGSGVRQLTDEPGRDYDADRSPDGRTLVFASQRAGEDGAQLGHRVAALGHGAAVALAVLDAGQLALLVDEVLEVDAAGLIARRVEVRQVVGDHVQGRLLCDEARGGGVKCDDRHGVLTSEVRRLDRAS